MGFVSLSRMRRIHRNFAGQIAVVRAGLGAKPDQRVAIEFVGPRQWEITTRACSHRRVNAASS